MWIARSLTEDAKVRHAVANRHTSSASSASVVGTIVPLASGAVPHKGRMCQRALQVCPEGASFAWAYAAESLRLLGRQADADAARRRVPQELWRD